MNRKPLTTKQLKDALTKRSEKVRQSIEAFRGDSNPQVQELFIKSQAELETLTSVIEAIDQRTTYFLEH